MIKRSNKDGSEQEKRVKDFPLSPFDTWNRVEYVMAYTWESKSFYKSTKTTGTSGKNPLFVPVVYVVDWQVAKIDERFLKMNFVLEKQGRRRIFERVYHCFNGVIAYE